MSRPTSHFRQPGAAPIAIVLAVATAFLALAVTVSALSAYRTNTARRGWEEVFGSWDEVLQRYPATQVNGSALELERLAARLGVDITPRQPGRAESLWEKWGAPIDPALHAACFEYGRSQMEHPRRGEIEAPPPEIRNYITTHDEKLIALRRHLNGGEPAVWVSDLSQEPAAPIPNLLGHIKLQKLLTSVALARLHSGNRAGAQEDIAAAWQLSRSLRDSPFLIGQLILMAGTRMQLGALRHIPDLDETWLLRLEEHDHRESFTTAMKFEGWFWLHHTEWEDRENELPAWQRVTSPVMRPYTQLCLADLSDTWRERMQNLEKVDALCDRDLALYDANLDIELPRWNVVGKHYFPNLLGAIDRLARLELDLELTRLSIEADAKRRENGGAWLASSVADRRSTACPDDRWDYRVTGGELEIALSRNVEWPGQKGAILPTRAILGPVESP